MSLLIFLIVGLFCFNHNVFVESKNYDGYKVYNLSFDTESQREFLMTYDNAEGFSFWLEPSDGFALIMVSPEQQLTFESVLKVHNIIFNILQKNVGQTILEEEISQEQSQIAVRVLGGDDKFNFDHFPRYQEIINFLKSLVNNKNYSRIITIGNSYEGRPIYAVEIKKSSDKPVFVIDAGIHAREWAAPISAMYILKNLVERENEYAELMSFVVIPCLNPDGYEFTHNEDRLWRKSRSDNVNSECKGVDLNRNFDSHWGETGADTDPCSYTFQGYKPFSEPESIALRDTILKYKPFAYLTLHSFGPLLLYPWGFSKDLASNWKELDNIAKKAAQRMRQTYGTKYAYGASGKLLYEASGASDDWTMENGATIVYTMELPQYNKGGFIVPTKMIMPLVKETFEGFSAMVESIA